MEGTADYEQLSVDELKAELCKERMRNVMLNEELGRVKDQQLRQHVEIEQEEEFITNKLLKNLRTVEQEKNQILMDIDREQEFLTNTLHRKMSQILKEKQELEKQLKVEQDYINLDLHMKVEAVKAERSTNVSERRMNHESFEMCCELVKLLDSMRNEVNRDSRIHGDLDKAVMLAAGVEKMMTDHERYLAEFREKTRSLEVKLKKLEDENFLLRQKIERHAEVNARLSQDKARLENEQETSSERQFHAVQRHECPSVMLNEITQKFSAASSPRRQSMFQTCKDSSFE